MTIDELFDMPICEMKQWMTENFRVSTPLKVSGYYFFNIQDSFGLEIPKDSNWRIIPVMSTFGEPARGHSILDHMMAYYSDEYRFGVAKVSKYGECLVYLFQGAFEENEQYDTSKNNYNVHFDLRKIWTNQDEENVKCRCYIDGPSVVNNSRLAVYYRENDPDHKKDDHKWIHEFEFIDNYPSIQYNVLPKVGAVNKNKHSINDFNKGLEAFAKKCAVAGKVTYEDNKKILDFWEYQYLRDKCKSVHIDPKDVFELFLELHMQNQFVTFEDTIGMIKLAESQESLIKEYRESNKCEEIKKDYKNKYRIKDEYWHRYPYRLCLLFNDIEYVHADWFYGYLNNLEETRRLYKCLDNYKDNIHTAKKDYKESFSVIAEEWEDKIRAIYDKVANELDKANKDYLNKTSTLYNRIHNTYPGVNDKDVGVFADIPDIVGNIENSFEDIATKLMKLVVPSYKPKVEFKPKKTDDEGFTEEFKAHCKLFFDAVPECDKLPYYEVGKCYDAPYETYEWDRVELILDGVHEDHIFAFEEKYGQGSFKEWADDFTTLAPYDKSWESGANDLYPGQDLTYYITREFKSLEVEED